MSPERAVLAMDTSIKYHRHRDFMKGNHEVYPLRPPSDDRTAAQILARVSHQNRSPLLHEALQIVESVGLKTPEYRMFQDAGRIDAGIDGLPGPYAVKVIAQGVSHKSDLAGVVLGLPDGNAAHAAAGEMMERFGSMPDAGLHGVLVQTMAPRTSGSFELIVGGKRDPQFGPVVLLGHGGIFVEVFGKTSLRMAPLSGREIEQMIEDLPGSEIFKGVRGRPPVDVEALKDAIGRVAHLMVEFPEISSIDINPLLVSDSGALCLDARIVLAD
jgi:acyl-CoA synthetase (NDP forming)